MTEQQQNPSTSTATSPPDNWFEFVRDNLLPRYDDEEQHRMYSSLLLEDLSVRIDERLADQVQRSIKDLIPPDTYDDFYPPIVISYATAWREDTNDYPGKLVAASVIQYLFAHGYPCYSDLMTPAGRNWLDFNLRIKRAKVVIVLMTRAFFRSRWCLEELYYALQHASCNFLPIRVEATSSDESGKDLCRDETSMWPDELLNKWVGTKGGRSDFSKQWKLNEFIHARDAAKAVLMNVSSLPEHGTLLSDGANVLNDLVKWLDGNVQVDRSIMGPNRQSVSRTKGNDTDDDEVDVIDVYFAVQCQPSRLLHNLDGRPEMLRDLNDINDDIEKESGPGELFDRDYKIYLTDGTELASALRSSKIRILVWCGRGIDACGQGPEQDAFEAISKSTNAPEVVVICMEYGARHVAERLHKARQHTDLVWIRMNPFQDLVKLSAVAFLPFCSSYLKSECGFASYAETLTMNMRNDMFCHNSGFIQATISKDKSVGHAPSCPHLKVGETLMPIQQLDRRLTVSLNWDRSLKQLKVDRGDLEVLKDLKEKLSPEDGAEHYFVSVKALSKQQDYCRSRALAFCGCMDMAGKFRDGIYRVACKGHKDLGLKGKPREALIWIDLIRWMDSPFENADDLIDWINGLGRNLTATVLLTADSAELFKQLETMLSRLDELNLKVDSVATAGSPTCHEIPVNTLVGSFRISSRTLDSNGSRVPFLDLPNIDPVDVAVALKEDLFSAFHMEGEGIFDGSIYRDDDDSIWVRFFANDMACITALRDRILLGNAAKQLATTLKLEQGSVEFDSTSMAEVFESMVLQLETLTKHQEQKLDECEIALDGGNKCLHIQGAAGTGKTFLALNLLLNYLEATKGNVLYVCGSHSTAFQFCKWIVLRLRPLKNANRKLGKVFLLTGDKPDQIFQATLDESKGLLREKDQFERTKKQFDLIVIDEAHDVFKVGSKAASAVSSLLSEHPRSRFILISDPSQASVSDDQIAYPKKQDFDSVPVQLTEVCRCTKRVVLGARCFQFDTSGDVSVSHDSDGVASVPVLFPRHPEEHKFEMYAEKIWEVMEDVLEKFPGLDLHNRIAIVVPDEKCRNSLCEVLAAKFLANSPKESDHLGQHLRLLTAHKACSCVSARSRQPLSDSERLQSLEHPQRISCIVCDSADNVAGLEYLIVLGVDLDASLLDVQVSERRLVCSRIFRAMTRTQLMFYIINEQVKNGWYEFLLFVEEKKDDVVGRLSFNDELSKIRHNAVTWQPEEQPPSVNSTTLPVAEDTNDNVHWTTSPHLHISPPQKIQRIIPRKSETSRSSVRFNLPGNQSMIKQNDKTALLQKATSEVGKSISAAWDTSKITTEFERNMPLYNPLVPTDPFLLSHFMADESGITCCAVFANDTRVISGGLAQPFARDIYFPDNKQLLKVWDLATQQELYNFGSSVNSFYCCKVFANDTRAICGSYDDTLLVWDLINEQWLHTLQGHIDAVNCCDVFADDTRVISGCRDCTLKVWNSKNGKELYTLQGHTDWVNCCTVFAIDFRLMSGSRDCTLKVWDLTNRQELYTLQGHAGGVTCCAVFAKDTRAISGSSDMTLKVWDLMNNGKELYTLQGYAGPVTCCAVFANDTRVISGSGGGTLKVWNLRNGHVLSTLQEDGGSVLCCAVYASDTRVICGCGNLLQVWSLPSALTSE